MLTRSTAYFRWLPTSLRKLSHGKSDKNLTGENRATKKFDRKTKVSTPSTSTDSYVGNDEDGEDEVELPPPMKPISESLLVSKDDNQQQVSYLTCERSF